MEDGAHIITMASRLLGPVGKALAWLLYLFICYASLVAYTAGGGGLLAAGFQGTLGISIAPPWDIALFVAIFGPILYLGNVILGKINTLLMFGLGISYLLLVAGGAGGVRFDLLARQNCTFGNTFIAVPLLLTIFSFQTIVPSLTIYLKQDGRALRLSIILGTTISLVVYIIWQWLVLGTVMFDGDMGLGAALAAGKPATEFLGVAVRNPYVQAFADFFAFFALVTSFLGIALGLFDFLADGLKIKKEKWGHLSLGLLVAIPTLFFALTVKNVFLRALDSSGGIGDAILNGFMPALMLYVGRYLHKRESEYRIPGGRPLIFLIMTYATFVFVIEILGRLGVIVSLGC